MNTQPALPPREPLILALNDDDLLVIASEAVSQFTSMMHNHPEMAGDRPGEYASVLEPLRLLLEAAANRSADRI